MRENFDNRLKEINIRINDISSKVEEILGLAIKSLQEKDKALAEKAIHLSSDIKEIKRETEQLCIKVLLMQQPVYADNLKYVSSAFKVLTDIERMGDQAGDISALNLELLKKSELWNMKLITQMAERTAEMVSLSILSYSNKDIGLAKRIMTADDEVDKLFYKIKAQLVEYIVSSKNKSDGINALDTLLIAKYLERIADHAHNVSQWAIYSVRGIQKT